MTSADFVGRFIARNTFIFPELHYMYPRALRCSRIFSLSGRDDELALPVSTSRRTKMTNDEVDWKPVFLINFLILRFSGSGMETVVYFIYLYLIIYNYDNKEAMAVKPLFHIGFSCIRSGYLVELFPWRRNPKQKPPKK